MNKTNNSIALSIAVIGLLFIFNACAKKTTDPEPETPKSLNKSLLVGKTWYNKGGSNVHIINSNGIYGSSGTWFWKNTNSDTMVCDIDGSGTNFSAEDWKFFWSAEHEMACKQVGTSSGEILYKDAAW